MRKSHKSEKSLRRDKSLTETQSVQLYRAVVHSLTVARQAVQLCSVCSRAVPNRAWKCWIWAQIWQPVLRLTIRAQIDLPELRLTFPSSIWPSRARFDRSELGSAIFGPENGQSELGNGQSELRIGLIRAPIDHIYGQSELRLARLDQSELRLSQSEWRSPRSTRLRSRWKASGQRQSSIWPLALSMALHCLPFKDIGKRSILCNAKG